MKPTGQREKVCYASLVWFDTRHAVDYYCDVKIGVEIQVDVGFEVQIQVGPALVDASEFVGR